MGMVLLIFHHDSGSVIFHHDLFYHLFYHHNLTSHTSKIFQLGDPPVTLAEKQKAFGGWTCSGHGTVDPQSNMYLGETADKHHTDEFFRESKKVFCSVLLGHAGVLDKFEKKAFFPRQREFVMLFDYSVIEKEMEGREVFVF